MPRTISDEEYKYLQDKRMTADFVESIYNDPQLNKEAKRLIKRKYPNLAIPDFDLETKVEVGDGEVRVLAFDEALRLFVQLRIVINALDKVGGHPLVLQVFIFFVRDGARH